MSQGGIGRNVLSDLTRFLIRRAHDEGLPSYGSGPDVLPLEERPEVAKPYPSRPPMMTIPLGEPNLTKVRYLGKRTGKRATPIPFGEGGPVIPTPPAFEGNGWKEGFAQDPYAQRFRVRIQDNRSRRPSRGRDLPSIVVPDLQDPGYSPLKEGGYDPETRSKQDLVQDLIETSGMSFDDAFLKVNRTLSDPSERRFSTQIPGMTPSADSKGPSLWESTPKELLPLARRFATPPPEEPDIRAALKGPLAPLVPVLKGMSDEDRIVAIDNIMGNLENARKNSPMGSYDETNEAVGEVSGASSLGPTKKRLLLQPLDYLEPAGQFTKLGKDMRPLRDRKRSGNKYDSHQAAVLHQLNPLLEPGVGLVNPAYDALDVKKAVLPLAEMPKEMAGKEWYKKLEWKQDRYGSLLRKMRGAPPEITRQLPEMLPELHAAWMKRQMEQVRGTPNQKLVRGEQGPPMPGRKSLFEHLKDWEGDPKLAAKARESLRVWSKARRVNDPVAMNLAADAAWKFLGRPNWKDREQVREVLDTDLPWVNHALNTAKVQAGLTEAQPGSKRWKRVFNEGAMDSAEEFARQRQAAIEYDGKDPALEKHDSGWTQRADVKDAVRAYAKSPKLRPDLPTPETQKTYAIKVLSMGQERKRPAYVPSVKAPEDWALAEVLKGIKSLESIKQAGAQGNPVARVLGDVLGAVEDRGSGAAWELSRARHKATGPAMVGMIERVEKIVQTLIRHAQ